MFESPKEDRSACICVYIYICYICLFFRDRCITHSCKLTWLAGKWIGWRWFSYWTWGYSIAMSVYQSVIYIYIWFPKIGVPQNGWFIMENPIKMDDLGGKPTIFGNTHIYIYIYMISKDNFHLSPKNRHGQRSMAVLLGRDLWLRLFTSNREVQTMGDLSDGGGHIICAKVYDVCVHLYIYSMIYLQYMSVETSWIQFGEWFFFIVF